MEQEWCAESMQMFLLDLVSKKFSQKVSTMELMTQAQTELELSMVVAVALLEVDEANRYHGMNNQQIEFVKECYRLLSGNAGGEAPIQCQL